MIYKRIADLRQRMSAGRFPMVWLLVEIMSIAILSGHQPSGEPPEDDALAARSSPGGITSDKLFSKLLEHNRAREAHLQQYSLVRTYALKDDKGKLYAKEVVLMRYRAPDRKTFVPTVEEGSRIVRALVFRRLMESEADAAAGRPRRDSSISPENYDLRLVGQEDVDGYKCFVVEAVPKRRDKYLFEGTIWIDAREFAIVRIAGRPAKAPSFWVKRADFVRQYQKRGEFWLPAREETIIHLRIYGKRILTIDHHSYEVNGGGAID